ncbi:MAG: hypothetical protein ACKOWI_06330, partial [Rhodoluna sp.]
MKSPIEVRLELMFQPKRQKKSFLVNRLLTLVISGGLLAGFGATSAQAETPTPTPTPENTHQAVTPTPIADPIGSIGQPTATPVPTASPSIPPVVCGVCFNPKAFSLDLASSLWVVANKQRPLNP